MSYKQIGSFDRLRRAGGADVFPEKEKPQDASQAQLMDFIIAYRKKNPDDSVSEIAYALGEQFGISRQQAERAVTATDEESKGTPVKTQKEKLDELAQGKRV